MARRKRTRESSRRVKEPAGDSPEAAAEGGGRRSIGRELRFLLLFALLLGGGFTAMSLHQVNDAFVVPFTGLVAKASGFTLDLIGQSVVMRGTQIHSERFAVDIQNGCNGLETVLIFASAVLAFPAPWRARAIGLVLGLIAIQAVNLVRVIALFLTGAYFPRFFDSSHTVVWQSVVILSGVVLWMFWANRFAASRPSADAA